MIFSSVEDARLSVGAPLPAGAALMSMMLWKVRVASPGRASINMVVPVELCVGVKMRGLG